MLKTFRGLNFVSSNFCRIDHTYEKLTHAQTSEKQVVPSCVEQRWRSLKDLIALEATTLIKMSGKLLLEKYFVCLYVFVCMGTILYVEFHSSQ